MVTGAEHNKLVYTQTDKALNMNDAYTFLKAALGEVLFIAGPETYANQRPLLQEIFKRERMAGYVTAINGKKYSAGWIHWGRAANSTSRQKCCD